MFNSIITEVHQGQNFVEVIWKDKKKIGTTYFVGKLLSYSQNTLSVKDGKCVGVYDAKGQKKSAFYCWDE